MEVKCVRRRPNTSMFAMIFLPFLRYRGYSNINKMNFLINIKKYLCHLCCLKDTLDSKSEQTFSSYFDQSQGVFENPTFRQTIFKTFFFPKYLKNRNRFWKNLWDPLSRSSYSQNITNLARFDVSCRFWITGVRKVSKITHRPLF